MTEDGLAAFRGSMLVLMAVGLGGSSSFLNGPEDRRLRGEPGQSKPIPVAVHLEVKGLTHRT